jgi:hypothetical protein
MWDGTSKLSARCSTYAWGLLVSIKTTSASGLRLKCSIIFWAFEPEPEAKIAIIFFIDVLGFMQLTAKQAFCWQLIRSQKQNVPAVFTPTQI